MAKKAVSRKADGNMSWKGYLVLFGMNWFYLLKYERLSSGGGENVDLMKDKGEEKQSRGWENEFTKVF